MGKKFEQAKKDIESYKKAEDLLGKEINKLNSELYMKRDKRMKLQREWYGIADGDILNLPTFEKMIKAAKRWVK